jgi:hypothetical protein
VTDVTEVAHKNVVDLLQEQHNQIKELFREVSLAVQAAESIAPTRPHPGAGSSVAGNVVLGPPAALFDRMRDAVRDWRQSNDKD